MNKYERVMLLGIPNLHGGRQELPWLERPLLELRSQAGDEFGDVEECFRWLLHARKLVPGGATKSIRKTHSVDVVEFVSFDSS